MDSHAQNQSTEELYKPGKETNCFSYISNICIISGKFRHKIRLIMDCLQYWHSPNERQTICNWFIFHGLKCFSFTWNSTKLFNIWKFEKQGCIKPRFNCSGVKLKKNSQCSFNCSKHSFSSFMLSVVPLQYYLYT